MQSDLRNYSFLLHTCNLGSEKQAIVNPFTGQKFETPVDNGLTDQEIEAMRRIFAEHGVKGPEYTGDEGYGAYTNKQVEFRCFELDGNSPIVSIQVELIVNQLSDELLQMILTLAREANLALIADHRKSDKFARVVSRAPDARLLERWPDLKELSTSEELRNWLTDYIKGDKVLDRLQDPQEGIAFISRNRP